MFELVIERLQNGRVATVERVYDTLHLDLGLEPEEARCVLKSLPHTLIVAEDEQDLSLYYHLLTEAGADALLVCREPTVESEHNGPAGAEEPGSEESCSKQRELIELTVDRLVEDEFAPRSQKLTRPVGIIEAPQPIRNTTDPMLAQALTGVVNRLKRFLLISTPLVAVSIATGVLIVLLLGKIDGEKVLLPGAEILTLGEPESQESLMLEANLWAGIDSSPSRTLKAKVDLQPTNAEGLQSAICSLIWRGNIPWDAKIGIEEFSVNNLLLTDNGSGDLIANTFANVTVSGNKGEQSIRAQISLSLATQNGGLTLLLHLKRGTSIGHNQNLEIIRYDQTLGDYMISVEDQIELQPD